MEAMERVYRTRDPIQTAVHYTKLLLLEAEPAAMLHIAGIPTDPALVPMKALSLLTPTIIAFKDIRVSKFLVSYYIFESRVSLFFPFCCFPLCLLCSFILLWTFHIWCEFYL